MTERLHTTTGQCSIPDKDFKTSLSFGGVICCNDHQPLSPRVCVPEQKREGQLTESMPATVHCHDDVL